MSNITGYYTTAATPSEALRALVTLVKTLAATLPNASSLQMKLNKTDFEW
jgi:hypothetical protein